jgi:hypothetical protein
MRKELLSVTNPSKDETMIIIAKSLAEIEDNHPHPKSVIKALQKAMVNPMAFIFIAVELSPDVQDNIYLWTSVSFATVSDFLEYIVKQFELKAASDENYPKKENAILAFLVDARTKEGGGIFVNIKRS